MRIAGGTINDFGLFHELELPPLEPGFVLIFGENEAGKSTLLAFFRQMLFDGFLRSNQAGYVPVLNGVSPRGRLRLVDAGGAGYRLDRQKIGGDFHLFDETNLGQTLPKERLSTLLGGITRDVYHTLFAFTLDELRELDDKSAEEVNAALYGVTLGVAQQRLKVTRDTLQKRLDGLFKKGGSNPRLNAALSELGDVQKELRLAQEIFAAFRDQGERLETIERELPELEARRRERQARLQRLQRLIEGWDEYVNWQRLTGELDGLPAGREGAIAAAEAARDHQRQVDDLRLRSDQARQHRAPLAKKRDGIRWNPALLDAADTIDALHGQLTADAERVAEGDEARRKLGAAESELAAALGSLGTGWTVARVNEVDLGVFTRDALKKHQEAIADARRRVERAGDLADRADKAATEAERELNAHLEKVARTGPAAPPLPVDTCRQLEDLVRQAEAAHRQLLIDEPALARLTRETEDEHKRTVRNWSEQRLAETDDQQLRKRVTQFGGMLQTAHETRRAAVEEARQTQSAREDADQTVDQARQRLDDLAVPAIADPQALRDRRLALRELRPLAMRLTSWRQEAGLRAELAASRIHVPPLAKILYGVAAATLLVSIWLNDTQRLVAALGGLALGLVVAIATAAHLRRQRSRAVAPADPPEIADAARQAATLTARLGLAGIPAAGELDLLDDELAENDRLLQQRLAAADRLRDAEHEAARRERAAAAAAERLAQADADVNRVRSEWHSFLHAHLLDLSLDPPDAVSAIDRLAGLRDKVARRDDLARSVGELRAVEPRLLAAVSAAGWGDAVAGLAAPEARFSRVRELLADAERQREALDEQRREEVATEKLDARAQAAAAEATALRADLAAVGEALGGAEQAWRDLLARIGLDVSLDPDTCRFVLDRFEEIRRLARDREALTAAAVTAEARHADFADRVRAVAAEFELPAPPEARLEVLLGTLRRDLKAAREQAEQAQRLDAELAAADRALSELAPELAREIAAVQETLDAQRAASLEELLKAAESERVRLAKAAEASQAAERLLKATGLRRVEEAVEAYAEFDDRARLEAQRDELHEEAEGLSGQIGGLQTDRGQLRAELAKLRSSEEVGRLRTRQEELLAELREGSREWAVNRLSLWMLDRTQREFELAHQPPLFGYASRLFETVTGGRYERVLRVLDGSSGAIRVELANGETRLPSELSRGTREQLFFCLRLGYVLQHADRHEPVPLILDDVLVNADAGRAAASIEALAEVARTTQIILFTCHAHLRDLVQQRVAQVQTLTLLGGKLS